MSDASSRTLHTACNRDCGDACSIVATVEHGQVVRLQGDRQHPVTRGFLCHRTSRFLERQYSPDRITTPLVRAGNSFEPRSWDEVLPLIAEQMLRFREESGPAAILHYRCGGSMGFMKHVTDYFFERFGPVTIKTGDVCTGAGDAAQQQDFGVEDSHDLFDLLNSRSIILWGKNPSVSQVHLLPVLKEAQKRGARLVLIDPVRHQTAGLCDDYLQPRPGGDAALALAVAGILFEQNTVDPAAASYCDHLDAFRTLACSRPLTEWAQLADVNPADIQQLADTYADGPSAIITGWGMQRRANGAATIRAIDALAAISGNLGVPGGGVSYCFRRRGAFDLSFAQGERVAPRTIPEPLLGPGILNASEPPVRMVWVTAANPVVMLPESRTVKRALESRDLTVVVDSFMTDTAQCADIVLPTTTMLEDDDLLGAYGHHWLAEMRPVVAAPDGVRTDYEIIQSLAPLVGLGDEFSVNVDTWKRRMLRSVENEYGPGQVECTFTADDAMRAADNYVLFRTATRQVCRRHGYFATFMCRLGLAGHFSSGWHLHQSVVDAASDANLFTPGTDADALSEKGSAFLAGLLDHTLPATVFASPTVNGFRRFQPNSLAPNRATWGTDHRGALMRVISASGDPASRIENRAGEPAANPYLFIASQIAAGLDGIERGLSLAPPDDAPYESDKPLLPASLAEGLEALAQDGFYRSVFGDAFTDYYLGLKNAELDRYRQYCEDEGIGENDADVTGWEQNEYYDFF